MVAIIIILSSGYVALALGHAYRLIRRSTPVSVTVKKQKKGN